MSNFFKNYSSTFRSLFSAAFVLLVSSAAWGQMKYGFKAGLNFNSIDGPLEVSAAGANLENWGSLTSFHIGISVDYQFPGTAFGIRGEVLYNKKGSKYTYEGESFRTFRFDDGTTTLTTGNSKYLVNVTNAYIDFPVMAHGRWKDLEFSAGAYAGLRVQSIGEGSLSYTGGRTVPLSVAVSDLEFNLDYDYGSDKPGEGSGDLKVAQIGGKPLELPSTLGAYFDYPSDRGSLYKSLDYGLIAGLSYYINSLYIGFRMQYGLADISNEDADIAKAVTDNGSPVYRNDTDRNMVYQLSVGFTFGR
ncbi:MAG: PorT family protein [Saprospiraceae bacterium]|jgi:hypothetical protein|nr:PorT family protein [Saprospiraceae bacterium]